jgi:hypothetical protein
MGEGGETSGILLKVAFSGVRERMVLVLVFLREEKEGEDVIKVSQITDFWRFVGVQISSSESRVYSSDSSQLPRLGFLLGENIIGRFN